MSDKKKPRSTKAEAAIAEHEARIADNDSNDPRAIANRILRAARKILPCTFLLTGELDRIFTLEGAEREAALTKYWEAFTGYLIALRNWEERPEYISELDLEKLASESGIDLETLPKRGQEGGDIQVEDWAEWMADLYGPAPDIDLKESSMETRMFALPPRLYDIPVGEHESLDKYLSDLEEWSEEVRSKTAPPKFKCAEQLVTMRLHGAQRFSHEIDIRIRLCHSARSNADDFAVHLVVLDRFLEKWRRAWKAAGGKKGRPKKPHTEFFQLAWNYGYETFDAALDFLDDITHGCTFDVDREKETIRVFPDEDDEPYDLTFPAARKAFARTH